MKSVSHLTTEVFAFYVLVAIVLFCLIARPHVGKVWYISAEAATTTIPQDPYAVTTPHPSRSTPPAARYLSPEDCANAMNAFEQSASIRGAYCATGTALLWGW